MRKTGLKKKRTDLPRVARVSTEKGPDNMALDEIAIRNLVSGVYSATARKSTSARLLWWTSRASRRQLEPFPLDISKLTLAAALLKKGAYRSAAQYLYTMKKRHMAFGGTWGPELAAHFKDVKRSCERGQGGARQAEALPLGSGLEHEAFKGEVLQCAEASLLVGIWWMLREIELANITRDDACIQPGGCGVARLKISASKVDWRAKGVERCHGFACPLAWCPVRALAR